MPTVILPCNADSYIDSSDPNTNFGGSGLLNSFSGSTSYRILTKFDWSSIPDNAVITNINIKFRTYFSQSAGTIALSFYAILQIWGELDVTWNNRPSTEFVYSDSISATADTNYSVSINNFDSLLGNIQNFGILISSVGNVLVLDSKDSITVQKPELEVTYNLPLALPPTLTNPIENQYIDRGEDFTVTWTTDQPQAEYELEYSTDDATWTTLSGTTAQSRTISGGTWAVGDLYFRIRYKQVGSSDWSDYSDSVFTNVVNNPAAPTSITSGSVTTATPTITATGTGVLQFTITIKDSSGNVFETATVVSTSISYTIVKPLTDGVTYDIEITYKDITGFDSDVGSSSITTAFIKPNTPTVVSSLGSHYIELQISNPAGGTAVTYNDVYKLTDNGFQRVATNISENGVYVDSFAESDKEQIYFVRAYASSGGYAQSTDLRETLSFLDAFLITVDTSLGVELILAPERRKSISNENTVFNFAGRKSSVVLYSGLVNKNLDTFQYEIHDKAILQTLEDMVEYKQTVCYRDARGRKLFLALTGINVTDNMPDYYTVSFNSVGVDFNEVV